MNSSKEWAGRRKTLLQKIGPTGLAIIPAAPLATRNADYDFPYRQNSDFYYMTGFEEPEAVIVLAPKRPEGEFVLFNRTRHREKEIWEGPRAGQEGARKLFGAHQAFAIESFAEKLPRLLMGRKEIYYLLGVNKAFDDILLSTLNRVRGRVRKGLSFPTALIDLSDFIHEMRLIKSKSEIKLMRRAATIAAEAHIRAMKACKPGLNEYQLEAEILYEFQRNGARYPAYTSIVGSGANSCILHYNTNNQTIQDGSLVLIDAGAEYCYYASDITRTFPANGRFSTEQRAIYQLVLDAQLAVINIIKAGLPWEKMHETAVKVLTRGLIKLGLLRGKLQTLLAKQAYLPFYMHHTGHWLGLDVHDAGRYAFNNKWRRLEPGMVLTVEPGIYISADLKQVPPRWHNIGVRIEDDILVTKKGCEVLSKKAPKSVAEIERLMSGRR
jgi:Xaa-Pro aminopeptidase